MLRHPIHVLVQAIMLAQLAGIGCHLREKPVEQDKFLNHCEAVATNIEYADVSACTQCASIEPLDIQSPNVIRAEEGAEPTEFWDLSLQQVLDLALQNNDVLKDLGGRVLTNPETVTTAYDPGIRESNPLFGPEGALSAFDTQLTTNLFWQNNDRVFNNRVLGGGVNQFKQDLATFDTEVSKLAATGTRFSVRNRTEYDANNSPLENKVFPTAWQSWFEATMRQPLLQGAGVTFNRIAGPNAQPGFNFSTGVLIARVNTDITLADFEAGVINFVSEVENAYWELYFAYRELEAAVVARDSALETWQNVEARFNNNLPGGEAYKEARARAQYFQFQDQVQDALGGVPLRGQSVGVYRGERRLRTLMAVPTSDRRLIRPSDSPPLAQVNYAWQDALDEALMRRVELRKQMWQIQRRELELVAARNFTLPRLDAFVTYRLRGFGNDLTGDLSDFVGDGSPEAEVARSRFASAYKDLGSWDHQEWEGGLQFNMPLGFRRAWAGVRQSQLQLARERAILEEQQRQVALQLSDAVAETSRAYEAVRAGFNRLEAAQADLKATKAAFEADQISVELVLDSQQRITEAQSRYYRSLTDYVLSLKNVHLGKGSLLQYNEVFLSEGTWPLKAYRDAAELSRRWRRKRNDLYTIKPGVVSRGPVPQRLPNEILSDVEEIEPPASDRTEYEQPFPIPEPTDVLPQPAEPPLPTPIEMEP